MVYKIGYNCTRQTCITTKACSWCLKNGQHLIPPYNITTESYRNKGNHNSTSKLVRINNPSNELHRIGVRRTVRFSSDLLMTVI